MNLKKIKIKQRIADATEDDILLRNDLALYEAAIEASEDYINQDKSVKTHIEYIQQILKEEGINEAGDGSDDFETLMDRFEEYFNYRLDKIQKEAIV